LNTNLIIRLLNISKWVDFLAFLLLVIALLFSVNALLMGSPNVLDAQTINLYAFVLKPMA